MNYGMNYNKPIERRQTDKNIMAVAIRATDLIFLGGLSFQLSAYFLTGSIKICFILGNSRCIVVVILSMASVI
jgi:hypothetical protein